MRVRAILNTKIEFFFSIFFLHSDQFKPKSYLKLITKYIFSEGEQFPLSGISLAIRVVGPCKLLIRVSYSQNYKTVISDKITCWKGEEFPLTHAGPGGLKDTCSYIFPAHFVKISDPGHSRSGHQVTSSDLTSEKNECSA